MKLASMQSPRRESLNLRILAVERDLIDRAALSSGKTRTDFILESARRAAEETLLDQAILSVGKAAFAEFQARLDAGPKPNKRLRRTMQMPSPWANR
ncbi:MAG: DUF1778 domain-containing protein [Burkholderiales bacterium]